jgi:hypothetical protein
MRTVVKVYGYTQRLNVIEFVKLIRQATGESLAPAKLRVDDLLTGRAFEIALPDEQIATRFYEAATALGALCARPGPIAGDALRM